MSYKATRVFKVPEALEPLVVLGDGIL